MFKQKILIFSILILLFPLIIFAEESGEEKVKDDFTEMSLEDLLDTEVTLIDVFGSHTHFADEWMVGYHF